MSGDYRLFIKIHNGFPEHPKTGGLSDRAFRNLIELWCYCSRNLTDGIVTKPQAKKILTTKSSRELIDAGYMAEHADSYEMVDYLDHQMSAQQVSDLREKRAAAGKRGGETKATHVASARANAKQTPSKSLPDKDVDEDVTTTTPPPSVVPPAARGTRLPADWTPTATLIAFVKAECPNVEGRTETENFRDYWHGKAGRDAVKVDWPATYRKWMRTEQARRPTGAGRPGIPQQTPAQRTVETTRNLVARLEAEEAAAARGQLLEIGN